MSRVNYCNAVFAGSPIKIIHYWQAAVCTKRCSASRHWHAQVRSRLVTPAESGVALARRPRTYPLQTGSHSQWTINLSFIGHSASPSSVQGSRVPGRLLYTSLRHSQPMSFMVSHSTSPDHTSLPAQHFRSSDLLCHRSDGLELATGWSLWPGAQQQQLQTIAEDKPISTLPLSTHSAVEMLHSALYKSVIDTRHWHRLSDDFTARHNKLWLILQKYAKTPLNYTSGLHQTSADQQATHRQIDCNNVKK